MKTAPLDFVLSTALLAAIAAIAWAAVAYLAAPWSRAVAGGYHVVLDALLLLLLFGLGCGITVRLLLRISPLAPGDHPMDERTFTEWKLLAVLTGFGLGALAPFTPEFFRPLSARLFGAKVGANTALSGALTDHAFISIASGCIVGRNAVITGHALTSGRLILRQVRVGEGATIGVGAIIMPGVEIGAGSVVTAGAVVTLGTTIPPSELWGGIPARRIKAIDAADIRG